MTKQELIRAIRQINRTADPDYLASFDERDLEIYLQRLTHLLGRRGRQSIWVRPGDTHAVVTLEH